MVYFALYFPGDYAFTTKDKLARTPATRKPDKWYSALLNDSTGPLSSTRIENGRAQTAVADKEAVDNVAQRLFSPEQSGT